MASLNTKTFSQTIQDFAASVQSRAAGLVNFAIGSILRAFGESVAAVSLWLQAEILKVLSLTRLATSQGADADSFVADFFGPFADGTPATFERLGAQASNGQLTFARLSAVGQGLVAIGSTVATPDGTQKFVVTTDTTNAAYSSLLNGYVLADTVASVNVPAEALTPGVASNVLPGTVTVITSPMPGIDTVTNASGFSGGEDAETTASLILRFGQQILSLRQATPAAVINAANQARIGLNLLNVEGVNPDGSTHKGFFYVVVDDGTGYPTSDLLTAVSTLIDATRADGIEFAVVAPEVITAAIIFGIHSTLLSPASDEAAAMAAVQAYVNALPIGATLIWTKLFQVAYNASPTIMDVIGLTINGGTTDIAAPAPHVVKASSVSVTAV